MNGLRSTAILVLGLWLCPVAIAQPARAWTVMVYMNADNSLDQMSLGDVREMQRGVEGAANGDVNVVVQLDRYDLPARRYRIAPGPLQEAEDDWGFQAPIVQELGEVDMGDPAELVRFARWAIETYPAKRYALVIWNHGCGWAKKGARPLVKGISYDDQSGNHISTPDLAGALGEIGALVGRPIDVLGMDACYMQMMEVVYEIRKKVAFVVGSEETEPGTGYPFDRILSGLLARPEMTPVELARHISQSWGTAYQLASGTTQSVVDTAAVDGLAAALDRLASVLLAHSKENGMVIRAVINSVWSFGYREHIDLGNFLKLLSEKAPPIPEEREAIASALAAYSAAVIRNDATGPRNGATGLAIYYPKFLFSSAYQALEFSAFHWDEMVQTVDHDDLSGD